MTVPSYTTDLVDIDLCEAGGKTWAEPTASGWTSGAAPSSDDDNPFQGSLSMSKAFNAAGVGGMMVNNGGGITLPPDGAFLVWFYWAAPGSLEADADGGIRVMVGADRANFKSWDVGGKTSYIYGGWINYAVNTTVQEDDLVGTGLGNSQYVGAAINNYNSIFKGSPFLCDATRYGRCEARMNGGETGNYATFNGYAGINDALANRWGLIQAITGGYLVKGLIIFGYGSVVDFRDANKALIIQNTNKVTANFNAFEVRQATSRVDLTSISILSLSAVSRGRWITIDNATVNITGCIFTDMGVFGFASATTILNTTFRRCDIITQNGATLTGCTIDSAIGAKAVVVDNVALITDIKFTSSGTGYALEGFGTAGEYTFTNLTFSGYGATGTTDAAIHVLATTGTVAISIAGGDTPTYKSEGATVTFPSSIQLKMTVKEQDGTPIVGAWAFIDEDPPEVPWIMNMQTITGGIAEVSWTGGQVAGAIWRVRKYGYKDFKQIIDIGSADISIPVTLVVDPQQT